MKKVIFYLIIIIYSVGSAYTQESTESSTDRSIESGYSLFVVFADDYEARSGKENSVSTMRRGYGLDIGYQFNFLTHLRINPYFHYRYVRFTSMIKALEADRANVLGIASTIELDWFPKSSENLMARSWAFFPLYILKFGVGVNLIRFSDPEKSLVPAISYTLGIGFPYKRFSIHVGGEGNLFFYKANFSELDAYKLKIGYWF